MTSSRGFTSPKTSEFSASLHGTSVSQVFWCTDSNIPTRHFVVPCHCLENMRKLQQISSSSRFPCLAGPEQNVAGHVSDQPTIEPSTLFAEVHPDRLRKGDGERKKREREGEPQRLCPCSDFVPPVPLRFAHPPAPGARHGAAANLEQVVAIRRKSMRWAEAIAPHTRPMLSPA